MRDKVQSILYTTPEGDVIRDSTSINWKNFQWTNGYYIHKISKREMQRPYLIAASYYGDVEYEDIILLLNNIEDPFEMVPESEIYIPKLEDINQFILDNRK
jgi:hypothetical protein